MYDTAYLSIYIYLSDDLSIHPTIHPSILYPSIYLCLSVLMYKDASVPYPLIISKPTK
jgi:hypothetical protein